MSFFTRILSIAWAKRAVLWLGVFLSFLSFAFMVEDDFQAYLKKLSQYLSQEISEKVYLQFDKPYYAVGDDIWFKAYITTTDESKLSAMSKVLYVDLINENNQIVKSAKLPIVSGVTWGDFQLVDKLEEGNYRIRAYTQYMRNFDAAFFFNKSILVGKSWSNQVFLNSSFQIDSSKQDLSIKTQTVFLDKDQKSIPNMSVNYTVEMDGKVVLRSSAKTNESGSIDFIINNKGGKINEKKSGIITYQFEDKNGKNHTRFIPLKNRWDKYIKFFPEGGNWVEGLESVVAFKANDASGRGLHVKGKIVDRHQKEVASFDDLHLGMGQFYLKPEPEQQYTAIVIFEDGTKQSIALPIAQKSGATLHVLKNNDHIGLIIRNSPDKVGKSFKVIGHKNGVVYYASKATFRNEDTQAQIPISKFPIGVLTFTILNEDYLPIAERIVFNHKNAERLAIKADNLKSTYKTREKINLDFTVDNPNATNRVGSYSVSVTNSDIVAPDIENESNILTYQWLTSDLKGYVEAPNYYFDANNSNAELALDNLLLTQGWRNFDWKLVASNVQTPKAFPIEKSIGLKGQVKKGKNPVVNGKITIFSNSEGLFITDTTTNQNGEFGLENLIFIDTARFLVQARTEKDKKFVEINIDQPLTAPVDFNYQNANNVLNVNNFIQKYVNASQPYFDALTARGFLQKTVVLEGVTVVGQREEDKPSRWNLAGSADYVVKQDVLQNCFNLLQCLQGRIPGLMVKGNDLYLLRNASQNLSMQILLDGMQIDGSFLSTIVPQNVEKIEALTNISSTTVYGSRGAGGVLLITTKTGANAFSSTQPAPGIASVSLKGYTLVRKFYEPENENQNETFNDGRTTIYWMPDVVTEEDGKFSLSYVNAGYPAHYRIVVEGMDIEGKLSREVFEYKVVE